MVLELKQGVGEREVGRGELAAGWWWSGQGRGRGQGRGIIGGQGNGWWLRSNNGRRIVREERKRVNIV